MPLADPSSPLAFSFNDTILDLFARQVGLTPDAIALQDDAGEWTYRQVAAASDALSDRLAVEGIGKKSVVAIYATRCASLPASIIGVWKAGAAVLVLDSSYPPSRLARQAEFVGVEAVISLDSAAALPLEFEPLLRRPGFKVLIDFPLCPEEAIRRMATRRQDRLPPSLEADDTAYILFTSGTSGQPKAIAEPHSALPHFLGWYARTFRPSSRDSFSLLSGLSHDPVFRDIFAALTSGARLQIPKPEIFSLPRVLLNWIRSSNITFSHMTPSTGRMLSRLVRMGSQPVPSLRYVLFGGEPLRWVDVSAFRRVAPNAHLVNCYGASETPQVMGFHIVPPEMECASSGVVPITAEVDDVRLLILDQSGAPAGSGSGGELGVLSRYLSKGYLNAPALTAERFSHSPFGKNPGDPRDRIYRTGDLCRPVPGGGIEITGRADTQVTIRGFRVELEEIESELERFPGILDAAVVSDQDPVDPHLYAFVRVLPSFDKDACKQALARTLPQYMMPTGILELDAMPLTPNGKLDRGHLLSLAEGSVINR